MAVAREHDALRGKLAFQHVTDRVEGRMVRPRHDELRETRRRELRERDRRPPTDRARRRAPARPARDPVGAVRADRTGADRAQEPAQEDLGVIRSRPMRRAPARLRRTRRPRGSPAATVVAGGSITVSERSPRAGAADGEQRDDAAVRVPDEVVAGLEQVGDERSRRSRSRRDRPADSAGTRDGRARRARTARRAAAAPPRSRDRRRRSRGRRRSAPSDDRNACNEVGRISFNQARFGCHKHADMLRPG